MLKEKVIWMSTGGTGGHLFPALACAHEMQLLMPELKICLIGGGIKQALLKESLPFPYITVPCGFFSRNLSESLKAFWKIGQGTFQACRIMREGKPDAVVGFGSYFSFPPILAARFLKIPLFLHAADSMPGKVIRYFSRHAECTFVQFEHAARLLKGAICHVSMALRSQMRKKHITRIQAAERLGMRTDLPTLLIFGGSQGARFLNAALHDALQTPLPPMQILHYTGNEDMVAPLQQLYTAKGHHHLVKSYETQMDCAWALADGAITRAGASTLAELLEYEVPSLLIPYPYAADDHQAKNARCLIAAGAGVEMLLERQVTKEGLLRAIIKMIHSSSEQQNMQTALALYKCAAPKVSMGQMLLKQLYG